MRRRPVRLGAAWVTASLVALGAGAPLGEERSAPAAGAPRAQAYHLYSMALQSLLDRDYDAAVTLLEHAAARDPSPDLMVELARLHFGLGHSGRAEELAGRAALARPDSAAPHRILGDIHLMRAREGIEPEANIVRAIRSYAAARAADPADEDIGRLLAELYYRTQQFDRAAEILEPLVARRPGDPALALLAAKILFRTGRIDEAQAILERLVGEATADVEAADTLASIYELRDDYDGALAVYRSLLEGRSDSAYLLYRIGYLELLNGRYAEALRDLEASHAMDPADGRCLLPLAQAHEGAGDLQAAMAGYSSLIERDPANLEARFHRARLQVRQGDRPAALAGFRDTVARAEGRARLTERHRAVLALAHMQIGLLEMHARRFAEAVASYRRAIDVSRDPGPELFLLLGRASLRSNDPTTAEEVITEASRLYPEDLDLRVLRGEAMIARGERSRARELYLGLIEEQSSSAQGYLLVSEALLRQEWFEEADALLAEGTRRHPGDDRLLFNRGAAAERLGRFGEAERLLVEAIGINPENAMALNYLGYMLADRGLKLQDSVAYVRRALDLDPENPSYLDSLGWAQFKLAHYDSAEQSLRAAVRHDETDPTIREHLGDLLMATGRFEEAMREWEAALRCGHEEPERVRKKLDEARARLRGPAR